MKREYWTYAIVYFIQGSLGLLSIAFPLFLKDIIGLSTAEVAYLLAISSLPWVLKPIYGLITDYFPIRGLRRKPYIIASSLLAALGWFIIADTKTFWVLVVAKILADIGFAAVDVVTDGFAVERSTKKDRGLIQSICWGFRSVGATLTGFVGAVLIGTIGYQNLFRAVAFLPLLTIVAVLYVKEPVYTKTATLAKEMKDMVRTLVTNKQYLLVALFTFLFFVTPSLSIPFLFHMRDALGFTNAQLGFIVSISSLGSMFGAIVYAKFLDRYSIRKVLTWMVWVSAIFTFSIFLIRDQITGYVVYFLLGVLYYLAFMPILKISAKVSPPRFAATAFAILMGVVNLSGAVLSQSLGGYLHSLFGIAPVVFIAAGTNLLALPVIRFLKE